MSRLAPILPALAAAARPAVAQARSTAVPRATLAQVRAGAAAPGWTTVGVAAGLSVALHLAAVAALAPRAEVAVEGGGPPALAALGHAFEDFVQGAQPVTPSAAPAPAPAALAPAAPAAPASRAPAEVGERVLPEFSDPVALARPGTAAPAPAPPAVSPRLAPSAPPPAAAPARPDTTVARDEPEVTVQAADADTPRPPPRPDPAARTHPAAPQPAAPQPARQQAAPQQPAGTAAQDARRGAETGQAAAPAARAGATERPAAAASGSAAAANYPGEVLRQLQRTRRARVAGRGTAVVVFAIADSGALASVAIAASSGNAPLDQAALDHIRRSAPFPPPPAAAQRQFRFEFEGR